MTRQLFSTTLEAATAAARALALEHVTNAMPEPVAYRVRLNQSFDGNPLAADEVTFPENDQRDDLADAELTSEQVVELLCRDERVPEWIDISAARITATTTVFRLLCCGRYTANHDRLYYRDSPWPPFGIKSPDLPRQWQQSGDRFDLNTTRQV